MQGIIPKSVFTRHYLKDEDVRELVKQVLSATSTIENSLLSQISSQLQVPNVKSLKSIFSIRNSFSRRFINMVSEKKVEDRIVFLCDICGLGYADRKTAQKCEDYCRAHPGSCSAEIAEKAIYTPGAPMLPKKK